MSGGQLQALLLLTSPLGDDSLPFQESVLHGVGLHAQEEISRPFEVSITVVSTTRSIDPDELVYQPVGLTVRKQPGADRFFNGIVRSMSAIGQAQRSRWMYRLDVVPRLWFLGQTEDCRIFQNKTAQDILQTIFSEHSIQPVEFRIYGDKPVREYTTQYNETDLAFVHRLMQESGWFYIFEHTKSTHTLVVTDRNQSFKPVSKPPHWVIHEGNNIDVFDQWGEALSTAHGEVKLQDYDPTRPNTPIIGTQTTTQSTPGAATRDVFNWPALTTDNKIAGDRAKYRIENAEAAASLCHGHGYDQEFMPGRRFTLAKDPFTEAEGIDYALQSVRHEASDDTWIGGAQRPHYENSFSCFLQKTNWREPARNTRPAMTGIFSGIVIGNDGEEIHADKYGRIKVRLMFDRRKDTVAGMATWVRVMQPWSGNTWGWQHLPRVGSEVAVSFMDGDPDSPVVVGSFYNQNQMPVFEIPGQQTKQGFRSRSTLHGGTQDYSEWSVDDKKGEELLFVHAQKDYTTEVENDQRLTVDRDRMVTVKRDETVMVTRNHSLASETGHVTIEAALGITFRVAENTIRITPEGILINGMTVNIVADAVMSLTGASVVNVESAAMVLLDAPLIFSTVPVVPNPEEVETESAVIEASMTALAASDV
ncbi:type VI secretion system Vgr family protein [Lichenicola sp.]|uniref:type VI secretion system Vgr family protein n=1 Tax=Lichenicola sp. TaxID=2804529 RepID=UPI003B00A97F